MYNYTNLRPIWEILLVQISFIDELTCAGLEKFSGRKTIPTFSASTRYKFV